MKIEYLSRFDREFEKLDDSNQHAARKAVDAFLDHLQTGTRRQGLGLRRLRQALWEIRVGLRLRVLVELGHDGVTFVFCGTHDGVNRFLRSF